MVSFREEATILVKEVLEEWNHNHDFDRAVTILEDYLTDMDTKYKGIFENATLSS